MSAAGARLPETAPVLAADTVAGAVALTVGDRDRARAFYEDVLGLQARALPDGDLVLDAGGGEPLIILRGDPTAPARDPRAPGLFHLALRLPTRGDLAHALLRVAAAGWPLSGASDHLVSEALYLSDPDGNGIELYRDRPRAQWPTDDAGALRMATLALDLRDLVSEAGAVTEPERLAPAATVIGHVHLQASDLPRARAFYHGVLGFDVTVELPSALFLSAGGYHHHVGLNTWNSAGSAARAPGSLGLRYFEIVVPDRDELDRVGQRVTAAGLEREPAPTGDRDSSFLLTDPFGTAVLLRPA